MTHSFLLLQLGVIHIWRLTFDILRWYSILSFEFQCNVTTFSYLETNEIVSIVNFFIFSKMLNNPAVTNGWSLQISFLYFSHLSNSCIYKIVTYKIVETVLGTKWNISASQSIVAAIYNLLKFYIWTVTWSRLFINTVLKWHCTAVKYWISEKFFWS